MTKWYDDDATNRQIKVLKFFSVFLEAAITKGAASRIITRVFMNHKNRELWLKYVFLTGDESQDSPDIVSFDPAELAAVVVPDDWKPHGSKIKKKTRFERERLIEMVTDILQEGVPLDDPVPQIEYQSKNFCCTGKFQFGSRARCNDAIAHMGGCPQKNVTLETNYLIVGAELSRSWAHESYGSKIKKALIYKVEGQPVALVAEEDWCKTIGDI